MPLLTDQEKQDIIRYLEADKPLPDKYRFLLFEDKREVELVWNGKTNEVCNIVLPFQVIEQVDEPRSEKDTALQMSLFDSRGRQLKGWTNKLIWGDNKLILSSLKNGPMREEIEKQGGIKLIYIDPPFDVGADFSMDIEIPSSVPPHEGGNRGVETFTKKPNVLEELAYRDTWGKGADSFIAMIYERLVLMRDLLAEDGSIYVHCDWRVNSLIRLVLDEVFGRDNFKNQIIWQRFNFHADAKRYGIVADELLFYSKSESMVWNPQTAPIKDSYIASHFRNQDPDGRKYKMADILGKGQGPARRFGDKLLEPPPGTHWRFSQEKIDEMMEKGRIVFTKNNRPAVKLYLDEKEGSAIHCIWIDIAPVNPMAEERLDYPTQKPEALLERIIKASSNEGDLVADFFVGSGTTAAVAEKLGRKWIVTDLGKFAIHTTRKRMIGVQRELKKDDKPYRAFEILNLGKYERQHYIGLNSSVAKLLRNDKKETVISDKEEAVTSTSSPVISTEGRNLEDSSQAPSHRFGTGFGMTKSMTRKELEQIKQAEREKAFIELILRAYRAESVEGFRTFHGKKAGRLVSVGPVNLPVTRLFVEEVILECRQKHITKADILAFEFEMGLFPNVLDEAKAKGIDIAPKYIPAEVFDKRAVEKNQVVFHDVAFVEVKPIVKGNKVAVELTDFSVFYSQDPIANAEATLKNNGSKIVVEKGQIVKVSRDKDGIVSREVLTQHWTDWIDYWSVDFDFESKRETIRVKNEDSSEWEEVWTGDYVFENEWQSFRTKKDRSLELKSVFHECTPGRRKLGVKVVDIFGNDTMKIVEVRV